MLILLFQKSIIITGLNIHYIYILKEDNYEIKEKFWRFFTLVCAMAIFFASNGMVYAEGRNLSEHPPAIISENGDLDEIIPQGIHPPKRRSLVHDLSVSGYNYQIEDMGSHLYTDKWLTGASEITVSVKDWKLKEYYGGTSNELELRVYDSSRNMVSSTTMYISASDYANTAVLSGLSSSERYYVCFSVPLNSNRYSFYGSIERY